MYVYTAYTKSIHDAVVHVVVHVEAKGISKL